MDAVNKRNDHDDPNYGLCDYDARVFKNGSKEDCYKQFSEKLGKA